MVQSAIDLLERKARPSNDTARRLREARSFLRSYAIKTVTAKQASRHGAVRLNIYSIEWDESRVLKVRELLAARPHITIALAGAERARGGRA